MRIISYLFIAFFSFISINGANAQALIITTEAGNDTNLFVGTAPLAMNASINSPYGVAVDKKGNFYFSNDDINVIQKVAPNGNLSVFAGNGTRGFSGDGGPATSAQLYNPLGLACDTFGNLYIVDNGNSCVRKVDTNGNITTYAGIGGIYGFGYSGDGHRADSAKINGGYSLAFDKYNNLYIADGSYRVRKVDTAHIITTVVGSGLYSFTSGYGNGGPASAAAFGSLTGVAVDTAGNIYVSDLTYNVVRVVRTNDTIYAYAGTGVGGYSADNVPATSSKLNAPVTLSTDLTGNVYVVDRANNRIRKITLTDTIKTYVGNGSAGYTGNHGAPTSATMRAPNAICFNRLGNMFISEANNFVVRMVMPPDSIKITSTHGNIRDTICAGTTEKFTAIVKNAGYGDTLKWFKNSTPIAGNVPVLITDSLNNNDTIKCVLYAPGGGTVNLTSNKIIMTVKPSPSPIIGVDSICMGTLITLTDTATTGTWASTNHSIALISTGGVVTTTGPGTDTFSFTKTNGCVSVKVITVNPNPHAIYGIPEVCLGATITLSNPDSIGIWLSSDSTIALISDSGIVSGSAVGTSVISYVFTSGCIATVILSVNPLPSPIMGTSIICAGDSTSLSCSPSGGSYTTSDPTIAVVTTSGVLAGISSGADIISYTLPTGCYSTLPATIKITPPPIDSIISGITTICRGTSLTLNDAIAGGVWASSNTSVVSITDSGYIMGILLDTAIISYSISDGCFIQLKIIVDSTPTPIVGASFACIGNSSTLSNLASEGTWTTTNTLAIFADGTMGIITGNAIGVDTVVYTISTGCFVSKVITVNPSPAAIIGIDSVCAGVSTSLSDTSLSGVWASGDTTLASVTSAGIVTALAPGNVSIAYIIPNGCSATLPFVIKNTPLPIISTPSVCIGNSTSLQDSISGGIWLRSNANLVIDSFTGIATAIAAGLDTITYTLPSTCIVTKIITINVNPVAISGSSTLCAGTSSTLTDASLLGVWSSSNPTVATISATGVVSGLIADTTIISYSLATGCNAQKLLIVNPLPNAITGTPYVCNSYTTSLTDSTKGGYWSSTNATKANIDTTGLVTGNAVGRDTVIYTLSTTGCKTILPITINQSPNVIMGADAICIGQIEYYTDSITVGTYSTSNAAAMTVYGSGSIMGLIMDTSTLIYTLPNGCYITKQITINPLPHQIHGIDSVCTGSNIYLTDSSTTGTWISAQSTIGLIDSTGNLVGLSAGIDTISYRLLATGCASIKLITVNPLPTLISGTTEVCKGATNTLLTDITGGIWTVDNASVASITSSGNLMGMTPDTTTIFYRLPNGCKSKYHVIVDSLPKPITGNFSACIGATTSLSDGTLGGTWSSKSNSIATIDAAGMVTGFSFGFDSIVYQLSTGCYASAVIGVYPAPLPVLGNDNICAGYTAYFTDATNGGIWHSTNTAVATIDATGMVNGILAGTDTLIYKLNNGCYAYTVITVNPLPNIPTITLASAPTLCLNTLYQNFGTTPPVAGEVYTWSAVNAQVWAHGTNNQYCLVNFNAGTGDAVITLTANFAGYSCTGSNSYTVNVGNSSSDTANSVYYFEPTFYCLNSADAYQWGYDNADTLSPTEIVGATNQTFTCPSPDYVNNLYWVITLRNGCIQKTYFKTPTQIIASILNSNNNISIYPNPAPLGKFVIELPQFTNHTTTVITDVLGKIIKTIANDNATDKTIKVNLINATPGTYLIKVITENEIYRGKVIVK